MTCSVCARALDPLKGEVFVGEDGEIYCNDDYPNAAPPCPEFNLESIGRSW